MFGFVGFVRLINVVQEKMDKSAFEQKARTWREKAVSVSLHCGAGKEEAEDIAQDVMLRLWQMHDELERYQSVEAIVTIMARHQLRNHQRRKPDEALDEAKLLRIEASPQMLLEIKEDEAWLERRLQQMPTTQTAQSRRDSPTTGYRNDLSKYAAGKGTTNIIRRNKTEE